MKNWTMHLKREYFDKVKSGKKFVEMRLYDEKRKEIKVGDTITFVADDNEEEVVCSVENILVYDNFAELYADYDKTDLGYGENDEANPADMDQIYPKEKQEKYGAMAIEMELV